MQLLPAHSPRAAFNVLVIDAMVERTNHFRLQGGPLALKLTNTLDAAVKALAEPPSPGWDLLFTSVLLASKERLEDLVLVPHISLAHQNKKLKGVICYSPLTSLAKDFLRSLRAEGVPCAWVPYDSTTPSNHLRRQPTL